MMKTDSILEEKELQLKSTDLIDASLSKNIQWGALNTNTKLGVRHWTKASGNGHNNYKGQSNEFYFGPLLD